MSTMKAQVYKNKLDSVMAMHRIKQANKDYDNFAFIDAIEKYEMENGKNHLPDSIKGVLGTAYMKVRNTQKSEQTFSSVQENSLTDEQLITYARALKCNGKYTESDHVMRVYLQRNPNDTYAKSMVNSNAGIKKILGDNRYVIDTVNCNSVQSDFAPFVFQGQLYFTSARDFQHIINRECSWTGAPYVKVLSAGISNDSISSAPKLFSTDVKSIYNDGPVCFSKDGKELYITRNDAKSEGEGKGKLTTLKILKSEKQEDGSWSKPEELGFDSNKYSCGHASLSLTGDTLYFTSNMPGGFGGTDIYCAIRKGDEWSEPLNLGDDINTAGDEMFPFISDNGMLYFASDGHVGIGGLDLYVGKRYANNYEVINMGVPLNSPKDDFALFLNSDGKTGYFSSNREGGHGDDDIYKFNTIKSIAFPKKVKGTLLDGNTKLALSGYTVDFKDGDGKLLAEVKTDSSGLFYSDFYSTTEVIAEVYAQGYASNRKTVSLTKDFNVFEVDMVPNLEWGISGSVFSMSDHKAIPGVTVVVEPVDSDSFSAVGDDNGSFKIKLQPETDYSLVFHKAGYFTSRMRYTTYNKNAGYQEVGGSGKVELKKIEVGENVEVKEYEANRWKIVEGSTKDLDDIIQDLKDNPKLKIELGSFTDCTGSAAYNLKLSQRRAQSAVNYIINHGIRKDRVIPKGYGETHLLNKCDDGVPCSEEDNQVNRRSEIKILEM